MSELGHTDLHLMAFNTVPGVEPLKGQMPQLSYILVTESALCIQLEKFQVKYIADDDKVTVRR